MATPALAESPWSTGTVKSVLDGDSLNVDLVDGPTVQVRLVGVDADERGGCYYHEAKAHAEAELDGAHVRLRTDRRHDESGVSPEGVYRLFAYVYVDNKLFNVEQVREGYARERAYGLEHQFRSRFEAAQRQAQRKGLGLWDDPECP